MRDQVAENQPVKREPKPHGPLTMGLMVFSAIVLPPIGIVMGAIDLSRSNPRKRIQAGAVLAIALVMCLGHVIAMSRR